jgi:hypothetical protein
MGKCVAIVQSNYLPWKGYFDLIHSADEFVLFDDAQYTRRDWRNRNRIKTARGSTWLTIPVNTKGNYDAPIKQIEISDRGWCDRHWKTLRANYARAPNFSRYAGEFERLFHECRETRLSAINRYWLEAICRMLGIRTKFAWSSEFSLAAGRSERLVEICRQANADTYLSGPSARHYLEPECFEKAGIRLMYINYSGYPEYRQQYPPFDHYVSIVDLIFNEGPDATRYLLSF